MAAAAIVAAAAARERREICERFEEARAFEPDRAVPFEPTSRLQERQFARLIEEGAVREARAGRYWLSRKALEREAARRLRGMTLAIGLLGGVGVIALGLAAARLFLGP